ncbi:hypothetical protein E3T26_12635 [Cryobacterium sp. TMT1-21]|uniref:hypothetical protein n=1 Tax=Cryobacterium sp. TMT1-21 TaxID=1259234 RepID=UPI00106B7633|nr:hypothetical protein [Cryobacterium sp. TMT1-21]TFD11522.1 hypothetical protein E3T26_12635 [Cryobacterium sp. TMT1-21]
MNRDYHFAGVMTGDMPGDMTDNGYYVSFKCAYSHILLIGPPNYAANGKFKSAQIIRRAADGARQ